MGKITLLAALLSMGCGAAPSQTGTEEPLRVSQLPDVRGCDSLPRIDSRFGLKLQQIDGVDDLYLFSAAGRPQCIDSIRGVIAALNGQGIRTTEVAWSNPMPGVDPTSDANSNPMPGTDPGGSNPMPGTDPSSGSNNGKH